MSPTGDARPPRTATRAPAPELRQLADRLARLRTASGLSLEALAARTHRGTTSWARYLRGTALPPRGAVEELCRLAGAPAHEVLALWELAEAEWSGRARSTSADPTEPVGHRPPRTGRLLAALALTAAAIATTLTLTLTGDHTRPTPPPSATPGCKGRTCEGEDPARMGCGGADMVTTLATHTEGGRRVELRYGEPCAAVWARAARLRNGDRMELTLPGAPPKHVVAKGADTYLATSMTAVGADPARARVCLTPSGGERHCFTP
ncbi:DUF2690 domain-containing protein [Streptomyces sp. TRM66268-LWL]|uniref:DUF2690 domain-containing protein n=1 Tax=Streptomyces polyasparticus TaxID=2767826 RepID=A0ABR7SJG6_9ACTN|nr:XRE family transcriptional regulator [Streptomyces polyasparticus]MBC9715429.1 DUF2690 domain-containing protein [Streptomyces polyasparticus]